MCNTSKSDQFHRKLELYIIANLVFEKWNSSLFENGRIHILHACAASAIRFSITPRTRLFTDSKNHREKLDEFELHECIAKEHRAKDRDWFVRVDLLNLAIVRSSRFFDFYIFYWFYVHSRIGRLHYSNRCKFRQVIFQHFVAEICFVEAIYY